MNIISKIIENLSKFGDTLVKWFGSNALDWVLIGAAGVALIAFVAVLFCAAGAAKFKRAAAKATEYLKSGEGTEQLDEKVKAFTKQVKSAWKNYREAGNAVPAVYLSESVCVEASAKSGTAAAKNYFIGATVIAAFALLVNAVIGLAGANDLGVSLVVPLKTAAFIAPLAVLILGGIFALVLSIVNKSRYKKALAAYNEFIAALNNLNSSGAAFTLPVGATVISETYDKTGVRYGAEHDAAPAYKAADYGTRINFSNDPQKEDVVAQIERITAAGASKQTMLEVAKLLQAERAKAENKAPEQQKRLNAALATLLKAISTAK